MLSTCTLLFFFFQAEDGIRDLTVTGVQTCALPIYRARRTGRRLFWRPLRKAQRRAPEVARGALPVAHRLGQLREREGSLRILAQPLRLFQVRARLAPELFAQADARQAPQQRLAARMRLQPRLGPLDLRARAGHLAQGVF